MLFFRPMTPRFALRRIVPSGLMTAALVVVMSFTPAASVVQPNDNTKPAGQLRGDTLHLRLVVQMSKWMAEADTGPVIDVAAFAEEGEVPRIPAPLIRVKEGTIIAASVRNALTDSAITLFGLNARPTKRDSIIVPPGETREVTFASGAPGTYLYRARIGKPAPEVERDQAAGAFVVDPAGGSPPDRIFVINIWGQPLDSTRYSNAVAINGRSWPWTERIDAVVGDTLHWRIINASGREHPMHLHGAYFRVDSRGGLFSDTTYTAAQRRLAVTEDMFPGTTMSMVWSPLNPGRWLLHCHLLFHVIPTDARIIPSAHAGHENSIDPAQHMAGLVIGIDVRLPAGVVQAGRSRANRLDLYVQEGPKRSRAELARSFVLQRGANAPRADSTEAPSSLIVLTRGQPTDIVVHNRMVHPTSVHWHGLELESFSDGVAGWGGTAAMPTPAVAAGGTFTARLTMPRAGTFIYHSHLRDVEQLASGLYGPIVVLEPGKVFDPRTDHVHIVGWDAGATSMQLLINGDSITSPPILMRRGETHRFRFINIGAAGPAIFSIKRDSTLLEWRPVAKDGADLQPAQRVLKKALVGLDVGETYDFEFTGVEAGEYVLSTPTATKDRTWTRKIIVR